MIPAFVSKSPNNLMMTKIGISAAIGGIIRVLKIQNSICRLPFTFIFAKPNAAGVANTMTMMVVAKAIIKELNKKGSLDSVPVNKAL